MVEVFVVYCRFCCDDPPRYPIRSDGNEMLVLFRTFHESRVCDDIKYPWKCMILYTGFMAKYHIGEFGHTYTHSFIHSLTHSLTHSHSFTHTHSHSSRLHSLTHSLTHLLTHSLTHSLTHMLSLSSLSLALSLSLSL